jgi:acyl carrier protein
MESDRRIWEPLVERLVEASDAKVAADQIGRATRLRDDLGLGSLQAITLIMDLEEEYGVVVEDEELEALETVGELETLLVAKLGAGASESGS